MKHAQYKFDIERYGKHILDGCLVGTGSTNRGTNSHRALIIVFPNQHLQFI